MKNSPMKDIISNMNVKEFLEKTEEGRESYLLRSSVT